MPSFVTRVERPDRGGEWIGYLEGRGRAGARGPGPPGATSLGEVASVAVSATTGEGLPTLVTALDKLAGGLPVPDPGAPVRLWADRAFSISGAGTVVTGTLPAGTVHRGDELVITPSMRPVRVRGIQCLGQSVAMATGVSRAALNLRGVSRDSVTRGMALVQAGRWTMTDVIDVRITTGVSCCAAPDPDADQRGRRSGGAPLLSAARSSELPRPPARRLA